MTRYEVITGESSRKDAHNQDDLFERWLIKRGGELRPYQEIVPPRLNNDQLLFTMNLENIASARTQQKLTLSFSRKIESLLGGIDKRNARLKRNLVAKREELLPYLRASNKFISEWSSFSSRSVLGKLIDSKEPDLAAYAQVAMNILENGNGKLKEDPKKAKQFGEICDHIRDVMMDRTLRERGTEK